jgi:cell division protein FtsB
VTVVEVAALIVAIAVAVTAVFLITAVNNLNNTLAKLEDTAHQLRDEGMAAFRELRQLVADADAELDKVDIVLDRADQATTHISETTRRTHEAVQDPVIRTLAVASGTSRAARLWLLGRRRRNGGDGSAGERELTTGTRSRLRR